MPDQPQRIGLLAGWGRYPIVVAEALRAQGCEVYCIGLAGHADPILKDICHHYRPAGIARIGWHIGYFRRNGVKLATMAGKLFKHKILFGRFGWLQLVPDFRTMWAVRHMFFTRRKTRSDDNLLLTMVNEYARDGIRFAPATDFAPELLIPAGPLSKRKITGAEWDDVRYAWHLAKELGRLDVGQSVAVKGLAPLAVEAVEGTDECIKRAGSLCKRGGFTVVKVAKPQQDMRFDVPTIGVGTVEVMQQAGCRVLAIEADKTIVIDRQDVMSLADKYGVSIVAVQASEMEQAKFGRASA